MPVPESEKKEPEINEKLEGGIVSSMRKWRPKRRFRMGRVTIPSISRVAVPSTFTVMNMVSGYISIVLAHDANLTLAGWFIILAAFFDTIDGMVARLANASSDFGVELDSLSDLVSFGAAPSFLVYQAGLHQIGILGVLLSSALMVGSGLRLARFNVQLVGFTKDYFTGLPTPSQAMTIATFVIWAYAESLFSEEVRDIILVMLTISLSLLMVSKIKYDTLPKPTLENLKDHPVKMFLFGCGFLAMLVFQAKGFFIAMIFFILFGVIRSLYYFFSEEITHHSVANSSKSE
ncbi:MAG: CDP-diacylglycerol--serine O-phosphatidyltransferase [Chloroherpetonaceae bacterium]|nr:CDP-diacylglycerol--serine O-phosphatidyltransferase [Chloroherpetonaceae bacterium]